MGMPPKVQPTFAGITQLTKKWVTLYSWVCHLKYSLRVLTVIIQLTKLGYTALMGVPPKVQPTFADSNHTANKKLGYTALMGVPPKVQPTFADSNHTAKKKLGYTALMGGPPKVQPTFADSNHTANKKTGFHCTHGCVT